MRKPTRRRRFGRTGASAEREGLELLLDRRELLRQLQQSVHSFGVEVGLIVANELLGDEVRRKCGERALRSAHRTPLRAAARSDHDGRAEAATPAAPSAKQRRRR